MTQMSEAGMDGVLSCGRSTVHLLEQFEQHGSAPADPHQRTCRYCRAFLEQQELAAKALGALTRQGVVTPAGLADRVVRRLAVGSVRPRGPVVHVPAAPLDTGRLGLTAPAVRSLVRGAVRGVEGARVVQVDVEEGGVRVRVRIVVDRASALAQLAPLVQSRVGAVLSQLAGLVAAVDVIVVDVARL